ncbi:hypothetical protein G4228_007581 [Cervus hanglu yarkandensis]|uniref:Envelope glycoprotein n=1 Tax=Cervus hanglu yarkandensis TaxID=84702 RepID=A0A833SGW1_9CERV|nr:hypothetical protein G4228_020181 [Cervus hanglu yarkandensis]KAF4016468.1 hypothetical protein G4228_007581 [Cervus hanglu yarkandensis]
MNLGGGKSKSLLTVKVQKRGSFVSTCHKPNGRNICFYPITHWGYSDGGGVLDQNREKKQEQVIKNIISRLQATPEPYKRLDLLSQLRPLLKPPSGNQHLTRLLNSSFQFFQYTQHTSQCWICMSLSPSPHIAIPLPSTWLSQGNYTSPSQQKTTPLIGPVSDNVLLSASSNLTCINYSSPNYTGLTNSAPSFCSTWVLWNSTNNCTNPGIFILCGTYAYSCLPLDPPGPCILVFLTPGLTFLKEEEIEQIVYPQGKLSHRKRRAVIAPLLIGTGIAAALGTGIGGISTSAHFYYKLSQELNEDMEQVVESFVSIQKQINSLASVALQNRRALDLLTAEKGGTCLFLGEDCCYFVNETGIVQGRVKELRDRIERRRKELQNLYIPQNLFQQILPWLLPFLGPLVLIILFLLFGPCLFNLFQRFLQERIRAISRDQVKTILLLESLTSSSEKGDCGP